MKRLVNLYAAGLELTLSCPCNCETCGSSAGRRRRNELDLDEWLGVIRALAGLGCKRVSLLGGEPLRFDGWEQVARAVKEAGMTVEMITSGIGVDDAVAQTLYDIGVGSVTVSIDGTEAVHDAQRRIADGYRRAIDAVRCLDKAGLRVGVNTQVNTLSLPDLAPLAPKLQEAGAMGWQLQLTMPRGRAADAKSLAIPEAAMPEVARVIRRLITRPGLRPFITDNIGYLTRDDPRLRTPPGISGRCWLGCFAGVRAVGIMSDGSVKGCLALPDEMTEGNIRETPLEVIWNDLERFRYNRSFDISSLGGACATCALGPVCRGGCTAFALAHHGKPNVSTHCLRLHECASPV